MAPNNNQEVESSKLYTKEEMLLKYQNREKIDMGISVSMKKRNPMKHLKLKKKKR